jgi:hypothetical protein
MQRTGACRTGLTMWRLSNAQALIWIAAVVVALLLA